MWPAAATKAFWEFNLNPWDTAAGILLLEEAGGKVTDFSGGPFRLDSREVLVEQNGLIHDGDGRACVHRNMFAGRNLSPIPARQAGVCLGRRMAQHCHRLGPRN